MQEQGTQKQEEVPGQAQRLIEIVSGEDHEARARVVRRIAGRNVALDAAVLEQTARIVDDVRRRGDAALIDYAAEFDGVTLTPAELRVEEETLRRTSARVDAGVLAAIRESIRRVRAFHEFERQASWEMEAENGVRLGQRITAVGRAGLYVPGGTASYPSSVVMNVVPAQVAGVRRIVVATPPRALNDNPAVSAALVELGVTEVYAVGGAQAIAALAFGTETVPRVDVITGPGNKFVAAAKKLVFGTVGIDSVAGPTEVIVVADETARASFVAADLLAQAEHGDDASALLITTSDTLAREVALEIERQMRRLPRRSIIERSLAQYGAIIVVEDMRAACEIVNELAPEHLEIIARGEEEIINGIENAGAIFCGAHSPEAVGDYIAGPNHVLPTGGAARFSSALGVQNFLKRTSMIRYTRAELQRTAPLIAALAGAEGLDAHARSAMIRLDDGGSEDDEATESVKARVRELRPYSLTTETARVKINQNENPWDAASGSNIKREILTRLDGRAWSRYPDFVPASLHERLAAFANWRADGVIAGNGSNELIQALLMVTVGEGTRVLISEPTFALYRQIATILGGEIVSVPLTPRFEYDLKALREAIVTEEPAVTIICSPNNPTGSVLTIDEIAELATLAAASRGLVVIDEAYFEFACATAVPLLERHANIIILRTFSKALALAALRVGYLLAAPELAREISKAVLPYNLNAFSQIAAEVVIESYETDFAPLVEKIIGERERLYAELARIPGLSPVRSHGNFMIVRSSIEPRRVFNELLQRDILIRDVSGYPMLAEYFRASVGTPDENDTLIAALQEIFA